jgi:RNA polymerase sigma factor (sigma-70 family)
MSRPNRHDPSERQLLGSSESGDELRKRLARGDRAAAVALVEQLADPVFAFVRRLGGVRADAEDVTQDTLLTALREAGTFGARSSFGTWVFGIAHNKVREHLRAKARRSVTLARHSEGSLWAILIAEQLPRASLISLEGAGRPIGAVIRDQLAVQLASNPQLLMQANQIISSLEAGMSVADVPPELAALLGPKVQPYMMSWMKYDPAHELSKLHAADRSRHDRHAGQRS